MVTQSVYMTRRKCTKLYEKWIDKMNEIIASPMDKDSASNLLIFLTTNGLIDEKTLNDRYEKGEVI